MNDPAPRGRSPAELNELIQKQYLLEKIGADTAEDFLLILPKILFPQGSSTLRTARRLSAQASLRGSRQSPPACPPTSLPYGVN